MRFSKILIIIGLLPFFIQGQNLSPDFDENRYAKFLNRATGLNEALVFLGEIYDVNFIYEHDLIANKNCQPFLNISGNFFTDLQHALANHPIQYIKAGKKTIVLIPKEKAKTTRTIRGQVVDFNGHRIEGAEVFIEGTSWGTTTGKNGNYMISKVPEGKYSLTVRFVGYRTQYEEVEVYASNSITRNFTMELDVLNMDEVVTIASRNRHKKIESSVAITTAKSEQIAERAPLSTADLLKVIPGFYVESSGGEGGNNLFPRGIPQDGGYRYIAMYEDGLPIYEAPELAFANIDILMRLDESISKMEGVRGGTGSIYASNAPGGIINFISKTGGDQLAGLVKLSIADYGHYRFDYNYGGPLGANWRFNAGGFFRYNDGIRSPEFVANRGGQIKANVTRLFKNGYIRLYGKYLNDRNIFYLPIPLSNSANPQSIPGIDANYGTLTSIYQDNAQIPTPLGDVLDRKISDGIHPEMFSITNELALEIGDSWYLKNTSRYMKSDVNFNAIFSLDNPIPANVFADSVKRAGEIPGFHRWQYRFSDSGEPVENITSLNGNGLVTRNGWWSVKKPLTNFTNHFQLKKYVKNHTIDFSGYFSVYTADDFWYWQNILSEVKDAPRMLDLVVLNDQNEEVTSITRNGFEQYGSFYVNASNQAYVTAFSLVDELDVTDNFRFDVGVRYENSLFEGRVENTRDDFTIGNGETLAEQNVQFGDGTFRTYRHWFSEWALSAGANYSITPHFAVYGRLARGYRTPDFEQWIFSSDRGNSQYVQQFESGVKISSDQFALFGSAFYSRLDNIPFSDEIYVDGRIIKQTRFANSTTLGTEIEAIWTPNNNFRIDFIGTFQNPRLRDFSFSVVDQETGREMLVSLDNQRVRRIPAILIDLRPAYTFQQLKFFGNWQYIGRRFVDDANTAELPAYSIFNAGVIIKIFNKNMSLTGNVSNLTNIIGLTEGNPRVEQVLANRRDEIFMARPILGRSVTLTATYSF